MPNISYDDISKSVVWFIKTAVAGKILSINNNSVVARMNFPDGMAQKPQTPFCVIRQVGSSEKAFFDGTTTPPRYANITFGCIILGDTFTVVAQLKDLIMESVLSRPRINLYTFSGSDTPAITWHDFSSLGGSFEDHQIGFDQTFSLVPSGTMLMSLSAEAAMPGEFKFPVREVDSVAFNIRVRIR